jgi:hypothetical protein
MAPQAWRHDIQLLAARFFSAHLQNIFTAKPRRVAERARLTATGSKEKKKEGRKT